MSLQFPTVKRVLAETGRTAARFPFVVLAALLGTGLSILAIESESRLFENVIMASALGIPLMLALSLLRERTPSKLFSSVWIDVAGLLLLVGYAYSLPADYMGSPAMLGIRFTVLDIGLHFAVAFVPCLAGAGEHEFWQFNRRLLQRFALSVLYTAVLTIGLLLAMASSEKLFALNIAGKRYGELWMVMVGVFNTLFFLGGVPADWNELATDEDYPRGLRAFAQFALAPLAIVFVAILYLYAFKIIHAWAWPHGWVALPVCCLSVVGILAALLLQPAKAQENERWANWYWTWFFRALGPLSVLLLLSLGKRISEYGFTEWRYFGLILAAWLLVVAIFFTLRPSGSIRFIPASLALICFLSVAGPWGAFAVSATSQEHRLLLLLEPYGAVEKGSLVPAKRRLTAIKETTLHSILTHLIGTYGTDRFPELFTVYASSTKSAGIPKANPGATYQQVEALVSFINGNEASRPDNLDPYKISSVSLDVHNGLPVEGYRTLYHVFVNPGAKAQKLGDLSVQAPGAGLPLRFTFEGKPVDNSAVVARQASIIEAGIKRQKLPPADMSAKLVSGSREWLILFDQVKARTQKPGLPVVTDLEIYILEK